MATTRTPEESAELEARLAALAELLRGEYPTAEELATVFLREAIMGGIFRPGDKLNQDQIARALGVSRVPIRSSLRHLEAERLIVFHSFRGASVTVLTEAQIRELYEIRALLETEAIRLVIANLTEDDLTTFRAEARSLDPPVMEPTQWVDRRRRFYQRLYELSGKPRLTSLIETLRTEVGPYLSIDGMSGDHGGHTRLLDLVERRDLEGAQSWVTEHLVAVGERVCEVIRGGESVQPR